MKSKFLAQLHEVHRAIVVTPVVRMRITLAVYFSRNPYLDNHSSESIHTWTVDTRDDWKVRSVVHYFSNGSANQYMFGIILINYLSPTFSH